MDLSRRFGGIIRLYGEQGFARIQNAHICVIGIGGVGSWAVEALARSGIGNITMIDLDHIAESNVCRQIHALDSSMGNAKVQAMAKRIHDINPECKTHCIEEFITANNLSLLNNSYDYIIDCADNFRTKADIVAFCRRNKLKLITVGAAGGQIDPTRIQCVDLSRTEQDALLAKTRRLLRTDYHFPSNVKRRFNIPCVFSDEQPVYPTDDGGVMSEKPEGVGGLSCAGGLGSITTVTATFGFVAVAHVLKKITQPQPTSG